MTAAAIVAVLAAVVAVAALAGTVVALRRARASADALEESIARGRSRFDEIVSQELELRARELERTLAIARSQSLALLADEERRIIEERRRDVAERERDATASLSEALVATQQAAEHRLALWASDLEKLQERFGAELERVARRQEQLAAEFEKRLEDEAERLQVAIDEHRALIVRTRDELLRAAHELLQEAAAELEQHGADRRHALHELEERLRKREHALDERIDHEQTEALARISASLGDVEQRQLEQVKRAVSREATRYAEAAAQQFETTIRTAREEAARRLHRELDLAVERFAREANGVLAEQVEQIAHGAVQQVEARLATLPDVLARQRDETLGSFERRVQTVEANLRARLQEIATEAEVERELLDRRLHDLMRKVDEIAARA
jgi:hypothetical protein